jgi:hypothetical protein
MEVYLLYADDGPDGIAGQAMSITQPWRRLIKVASTHEAYLVRRMSPDALSDKMSSGGRRKNPRIEAQFSEEELAENDPILKW